MISDTERRGSSVSDKVSSARILSDFCVRMFVGVEVTGN